MQKIEDIFAKYAGDDDQWSKGLSSIQKHAGSKPHSFFFLSQMDKSIDPFYPIFRSIWIYMIDAEYAEMNEKSIFWFLLFLVFKIWSSFTNF